MMQAMTRLVQFAGLSTLLLTFGACSGCSKSAGNQDKVSAPPSTGVQDVIAAPQAGGGIKQPAPPPEAPRKTTPGTVDDDRFRLKPEEGTLTVEPPAEVKAGSEAVAKISVTPGKGYHVNTEYPIKLKLDPSTGVTLAKTDFAAGGHDKAKGDADALDEKGLALTIKMTPAASGNYTISGKFKFAVCDKDQCLAKQEKIAITVAAK
jgi:hypothetical protein